MDITKHKIFDLLWKSGMNEIDFCNAIEISKSAVTDWKTGKTKSYYRHLDKIAKHFNVSVAYLKSNFISDEQDKSHDIISKYLRLDNGGRGRIDNALEYEYNQIADNKKADSA